MHQAKLCRNIDKQYHLLAVPVLSLRPAYKHCSNHHCLCVPTELLLSRSSPVAMTCILFGGQLRGMLDFRLSLELVLSLVVDPVCSLARLTTLTLRPSQKEMRALLDGGAAEELPKMEQQPEASPRMVLPHTSQLCSSNSCFSMPQNTLCRRITILHAFIVAGVLVACSTDVQSCCTAVSTHAQQLLINVFQ